MTMSFEKLLSVCVQSEFLTLFGWSSLGTSHDIGALMSLSLFAQLHFALFSNLWTNAESMKECLYFNVSFSESFCETRNAILIRMIPFLTESLWKY